MNWRNVGPCEINLSEATSATIGRLGLYYPRCMLLHELRATAQDTNMHTIRSEYHILRTFMKHR